jgi:hypothetical protein
MVTLQEVADWFWGVFWWVGIRPRQPTVDVDVDALKLKNPHNRDARITFEPVAHKYFVDGGTNPDAFTSVTTWVHSHFEVFNADAVIDKMMASKSWNFNEKYRGKSKDHIKAEWDLNPDRAAAAGTDMHAAIELYYNNNARAAAAEAEELKGGGSEEGYDPGTGPHPNTLEFKYFLNFASTFRRTLRPYRTEWTVFHEEAGISGTIDMVFENLDPATGIPTGTLSIYDWKRSKEIVLHSPFNKWATTPGLEHVPDTNYWHYCLQLNVYKFILQEKYGKTVTDLYLVCLHPDNANHDYQRIKVADMEAVVRKCLKL